MAGCNRGEVKAKQVLAFHGELIAGRILLLRRVHLLTWALDGLFAY